MQLLRALMLVELYMQRRVCFQTDRICWARPSNPVHHLSVGSFVGYRIGDSVVATVILPVMFIV